MGKRYLQSAETGEYFLKGGADSPENFLAFADFDQTPPTHRYAPHARDWGEGDPTWRDGKGKNIIGALNYLAGKGMNAVYFLTMNVEGDGKDVWPWTSGQERFRFDCSKLDQWEIVFSHMDRLGIMLHVVTQETENDQLLDNGRLGAARRLYYRELVARFGHHSALVWNLGEENTNTPRQRRALAEYLRGIDPYDHPIVIHTYPNERDKVYTDLLGTPFLDGPSLQLSNMRETHEETLKWLHESAATEHPWFVCLDEIGPPAVGVKPDADNPNHDDVRRHALWGNLMAGGAGCEWYFGYDYAHSDLNCEDWRSREAFWEQTRAALDFFQYYLPFDEMQPRDDLVKSGNAWCFAKPGEVYAVYPLSEDPVVLELESGPYALCAYDSSKGGELYRFSWTEGAGDRELRKPNPDYFNHSVILVERDGSELVDGQSFKSKYPPLPIWKMGPGEGNPLPSTVYLPADYGFFIRWPKNGSPAFYVYDRPRHRITHTVDFQAFLDELAAFPDEAGVAWIETCTVHRSVGMPLKERRLLRMLYRKKGFRPPHIRHRVLLDMHMSGTHRRVSGTCTRRRNAAASGCCYLPVTVTGCCVWEMSAQRSGPKPASSTLRQLRAEREATKHP